jgi:hypothetical protein
MMLKFIHKKYRLMGILNFECEDFLFDLRYKIVIGNDLVFFFFGNNIKI